MSTLSLSAPQAAALISFFAWASSPSAEEIHSPARTLATGSLLRRDIPLDMKVALHDRPSDVVAWCDRVITDGTENRYGPEAVRALRRQAMEHLLLRVRRITRRR